MAQSPAFDSLALDPFSSPDDVFCPAEKGVGGCHIADTFMVSVVIRMIDEGIDPVLKITRQEVVYEQGEADKQSIQ